MLITQCDPLSQKPDAGGPWSGLETVPQRLVDREESLLRLSAGRCVCGLRFSTSPSVGQILKSGHFPSVVQLIFVLRSVNRLNNNQKIAKLEDLANPCTSPIHRASRTGGWPCVGAHWCSLIHSDESRRRRRRFMDDGYPLFRFRRRRRSQRLSFWNCEYPRDAFLWTPRNWESSVGMLIVLALHTANQACND